jgi:hypothetical protein
MAKWPRPRYARFALVESAFANTSPVKPVEVPQICGMSLVDDLPIPRLTIRCHAENPGRPDAGVIAIHDERLPHRKYYCAIL